MIAATTSGHLTAKISETEIAEAINDVNQMDKPRKKRRGAQRRMPKDDRDNAVGLGIYVLDRRKVVGRRPADRSGSSKNASD